MVSVDCEKIDKTKKNKDCNYRSVYRNYYNKNDNNNNNNNSDEINESKLQCLFSKYNWDGDKNEADSSPKKHFY